MFISLVLSTFSNDRFVFAPSAVLAPVPPLAKATVPVTLAALPAIFPETLDPSTAAIFALVIAASAILAVVTLASAIFTVVTALLAIAGAAAVPVRSPASWIFPFAEVVASGAPEATAASIYVFVACSVGNLESEFVARVPSVLI